MIESPGQRGLTSPTSSTFEAERSGRPNRTLLSAICQNGNLSRGRESSADMQPEVFSLSDDHCFLCGAAVISGSRSREHVFPKWLLREAGLWNSTHFMSNGTTVPYRQCVIPCCSDCNSGPLAALEGEVQKGFANGVEGVASLDRGRLSLWMEKIYYGVLRRGHSLPADRSDPSRGPVIPAEVMQAISLLHLFLQRVRPEHRFDFNPDSTFVCKVHGYGEPPRDFDWMAATLVGSVENGRLAPALAIRHKGVGVITLFGDCGAQSRHPHSAFARFADVPLHPVQFLELACGSFYTHSLFRDGVRFATVQVEGRPTVTTALYPPDGPIWDKGDLEEYARYFFKHLSERPHLGVTEFSTLYSSDHLGTFLYGADGSERFATADELA